MEREKKLAKFQEFLENRRLIHAYIRSGCKSKELEDQLKERGVNFRLPDGFRPLTKEELEAKRNSAYDYLIP